MNSNLKNIIELERNKLNEIWKINKSMLNPELLLYSKKLDELIVKYLNNEKNK